MQLDPTNYRKDTRYPLFHGYAGHRGAPTSIVIHTTNNSRPNTSFAGEALFLRDTDAVSAHYLVGKAGQIVQFLPDELEAWHAGEARAGFGNAESIGIENHVSVGETFTPAQNQALTALVESLMLRWAIPAQRIETHRKIALPKGRKSDPEGWADAAFYAWRDALGLDPWAAWGTAYPLRPDQRQWATAQAWLPRRAQLGAATSAHTYPDGKLLYVTFAHGVIVQFPGKAPIVEVY